MGPGATALLDQAHRYGKRVARVLDNFNGASFGAGPPRLSSPSGLSPG